MKSIKLQDKFIEAAKRYLKENYGEDTLAMTVTKKNINNGNGTGVLEVDCTVKGGSFRLASDWHKKFHFEEGKIIDMNAKKK